jgi:predicted small lipoprotein YifL
MRRVKNFVNIFFFILSIFFINGCGQTGDLYLPEEAKNTFKINEYET